MEKQGREGEITERSLKIAVAMRVAESCSQLLQEGLSVGLKIVTILLMYKIFNICKMGKHQ